METEKNLQEKSAIQHAEALVRFLGHPELALEHAEWAYGQVIKADNKTFWEMVIREVKHLQRGFS